MQQFTVLVVEDTETELFLYQALATHLGFKLIAFSDFGQAIKALSEADVDLVILDWWVKGEEAGAWLPFVKSEMSRNSVQAPVLCVTANAFVDDRERCMRAGFDDYLSKPFLLDSFAQFLGRWLGPQFQAN